ncbi:MAG: thioredoxin family protein [Hyphomicrobiales bacterium]|nr:thioredoxin family protein [Hyphomicrobiales bacterium]
MAAQAPICDFGWRAPGLTLPGVDGRTYSLADVAGPRGLLIAFICNHCPYVKAVIDRIARDASELRRYGVNTAAICSNDAVGYPEDSFENMRAFAADHALGFPYLHDEDQSVARAYGAVCTPDFFGFNAALELQYRGRLDASGRDPAAPGARRELFEAMRLIAEDGRGPAEQTPSIGCSIKWKIA